MSRSAGLYLTAMLIAVTAGCAASPDVSTERSPAPMPVSVAEINRLLAQEHDPERKAALLFERGHAWLAEAERMGTGWNVEGQARRDYQTSVLRALKNFEFILMKYPESRAAPDALFHIGFIYDYPNLSNLSLALQFYRRTMDEYPGTEPAAKAEASIRNIGKIVEEMMKGGHGQGPGI